MIGLIITINKYSSWYSSKSTTFTFNTLDEAYTKLVSIITDIVNNLNIDFPLDLDDFETIWFDGNYVGSSFFEYKIFNNDMWSEPWDKQDIYSQVLDNLIKIQQEQNINYEELYGEPTINDNGGFYSNEGTHIDANDLDELDKKINQEMSSN
jgi:hypothetical protein